MRNEVNAAAALNIPQSAITALAVASIPIPGFGSITKTTAAIPAIAVTSKKESQDLPVFRRRANSHIPKYIKKAPRANGVRNKILAMVALAYNCPNAGTTDNEGSN